MEKINKILDLLSEPILLLEHDGVILITNPPAKKLIFQEICPFVAPELTDKCHLQCLVTESPTALRQKLRDWASSSTLKPGVLHLKHQTGVQRLTVEGAGIYRKGQKPLIFLRFQPKINLVQSFLQLKKQNNNLQQEIANHRHLYSHLERRHQNLISKEAELSQLAYTDYLTKIPNRAFFHHWLTTFGQQLLEKKTSGHLTLAIFDIDYFKQYNDLYGHLQGDLCLQQVALVISNVLAENLEERQGVAARYGGEEFVIALLAEMAVAVKIVEKIFARLSALAIPHQKSPFGQVTLSAGIAEYQKNGKDSLLSLLEQADKNLYRAKQNGRRCLVTRND
jgi:diguanylate cyclase (GGDEF)-like protein